MSGGYALEASQPKRRGAYRPPEPTGPAGSSAFAQPTAKIRAAPAIRPALQPALRPAAVKPALPIGAPPPAEGKGNCPRPQRLQLPKSKPPLSSQGDAWSTSADPPQVEDSSAGAWTTRTGDALTQVSGPPIRGVKRKVESVLSPVNAVNGETLRSQTLRVSTVNSDRNGSFAPPEAAEEGDDEVTNMVLFAKVPKDWTEESATAYCSKFGRLLELKLDHSGALATYESCEAAAKAIAFAKLGAPKPYYPPTKDSLDPEPAEPAESAEPEDQANAYWEEGPTWKPDYPPAKGQGWMDQHVALADAPAEPEPAVPEANAYWEEGATWKPDYPPAKGWNSWDRWDRGNSWDRWDHGDRWDRGNSWDRWDHGDPGAALADTQEESDMVEVEIDEEPKLPEPEDVFLLVRSKGSNQMTTSDVFKVFGKYSLARIRDLDGEAMLEFTALSECISAFNEKQGTSFGRHELQLSGASRDDFQAFKARQEQRWGGARPPGR